MKAAVFLFILSQQLSSQIWNRIGDFPGTKRDDGAATVLNGKAYFGTGLQEGWSSTGDWYALDLQTLEWEAIALMPQGTERQYACAFAGIDAFYVFGGDGPSGALNNLFSYQSATDSWLERAPRPGKGIIAAACLAFGNKVFIVGGKVHHDSVPTREVWEYNISENNWQRKSDLPFESRWRAAGCALGAYGYLAGGVASGGRLLNDLYRYDPGTDSWDSVGQLPHIPLAYLSLQPLTNKLLLFGGQDSSGNYHNSTWHYRIAQKDWQKGPVMPSAGRKGGMALGFNEKLFYACGIGVGDQRLSETWMLDLPLPVQEISGEQIAVYPNPFAECIYISGAELSEKQISLLDANGREVLRTSYNEKFAQLQTSNLAPGIYYLEISGSASGKSHRKKMVKFQASH